MKKRDNVTNLTVYELIEYICKTRTISLLEHRVENLGIV